MKTKLEKVYLHYRIPALILLSMATGIFVGINQWIEYQHKTARYPTWTVREVIKGDRFTVTSNLDSETRTIKLCGVTAADPESKDFLKSIIDLGNGSIELEQVEDTYEAWVMLKPDYERQIHVNTYMVEKGMARHDSQHSRKCRSDEELKVAESIAKKDNLGLWSKP
ncbi:MAG: thermonuclease family protein [Cyanobacteria bacterium P01_A01_bin.137]